VKVPTKWLANGNPTCYACLCLDSLPTISLFSSSSSLPHQQHPQCIFIESHRRPFLISSVELRTLTITLASVGNRISTVPHCAPSFSTQPLNHTSTARESVHEHDLLCFLCSILPSPRLAQHAMVLEVQDPRSNKSKPSPPITHGHCATSNSNFHRTPKCQRRLSPILIPFATMNLKLSFDEQSGERVFLPI
jgi:hypothetical protein